MYKGALLFSALLAITAFPSFAQQKPSATPQPGSDDILILVNLTAKELKFEAVPNTNVEFPGTHTRTNVWVTDRQNLPDKVEPGVTYRNIGIQLRISSRFSDIERIVQEALGEVPVDDTGPAGAAPSKATEAPAAKPPEVREPVRKPS